MGVDDVRRLFAKKEKQSPTPQKRIVHSCIDSTRERNVGIVLKCLRLNAEEIREAIEEMDSDTLSEEAVAGLLSVFPTADEQNRVKSAPMEEKQSLCGQFFSMCATAPLLEQQLRCWLSVLRFEGSFQQLLRNVVDVTRACQKCVESESLRMLLSRLLEFCNELNKDLPSLANAKGFKVADLPKFKSLTYSSFDASSESPLKNNLLHLCLRSLDQETVHNVLQLRNLLQTACKVDLSCLREDLSELSSHVTFVRNSLPDTRDHYIQFLHDAASRIETLSQAEQEMNSSMARCSRYFHFKESEWPESLSSLTQFVLDVAKCT